jgi:hypothetical protein
LNRVEAFRYCLDGGKFSSSVLAAWGIILAIELEL